MRHLLNDCRQKDNFITGPQEKKKCEFYRRAAEEMCVTPPPLGDLLKIFAIFRQSLLLIATLINSQNLHLFTIICQNVYFLRSYYETAFFLPLS